MNTRITSHCIDTQAEFTTIEVPEDAQALCLYPGVNGQPARLAVIGNCEAPKKTWTISRIDEEEPIVKMSKDDYVGSLWIDGEKRHFFISAASYPPVGEGLNEVQKGRALLRRIKQLRSPLKEFPQLLADVNEFLGEV